MQAAAAVSVGSPPLVNTLISAAVHDPDDATTFCDARFPRFHATSHRYVPDAALERFLRVYGFGVGLTDGESVETAWACSKPNDHVPTHQMEPGQRHDSVDDAFIVQARCHVITLKRDRGPEDPPCHASKKVGVPPIVIHTPS
ncbi:hypothetical protein C8R43DRAFT_1122729 [Mycena crocata]|nr:hypothetical protein C8R43DRAFT_1122729 [Mycena crocata]